MLDKSKIFGKENTKYPSHILNTSILDLEDTGEEIEYTWTRDKFLLKQYTKLINDRFENELNFPDSYKKIDPNDLNSFFYIGHINDRVVAGVRMSLHKPDLNNTLPTETMGRRYDEIFKDITLRGKAYCEVTRFAADKSYRNIPDHYYNSFKNYKMFMDKNNAEYLFLPSSKSRIKLYNRFAKKYFEVVDVKEVEFSGDFDHYSDLDITKDFFVVAYKNI